MKSFDLTLYLVTDSTGLSDKKFLYIIEEACEGGITMLQVREKERSGKEYLSLVLKAKEITDRFGVPLIVDDRVDVALAADAAGVHVGQEDIPASIVRKLLGEDKILGVTAKTMEQAKLAQVQGADYLGVGAIYPTTTKVKTVITEVSTLNDICNVIDIPIVAIGGLNQDNMYVLKDSLIGGIAVVSAIMKSDNPRESAIELKKQVLSMRKK